MLGKQLWLSKVRAKGVRDRVAESLLEKWEPEDQGASVVSGAQ